MDQALLKTLKIQKSIKNVSVWQTWSSYYLLLRFPLRWKKIKIKNNKNKTSCAFCLTAATKTEEGKHDNTGKNKGREFLQLINKTSQSWRAFFNPKIKEKIWVKKVSWSRDEDGRVGGHWAQKYKIKNTSTCGTILINN